MLPLLGSMSRHFVGMPDETIVLVGGSAWSVDASSGKGVPANATEWNAVRAAASISSGNPTSGWGLQEASGAPVDYMGVNNLSVFGAPSYEQVVSDWTRKGIGWSDGSTPTLFHLGLANTTTTSLLVMLYVKLRSTPAATRDVLGVGSSTAQRRAQITTTPVSQIVGAGGQATGTGASNVGTSNVRPYAVQIDRTAGVYKLFTDQEVIAPTYTAPAGGGAFFQIGDTGSGNADAVFMWSAYFEGAAAELSQANVKSLLQTLGWTIPWS